MDRDKILPLLPSFLEWIQDMNSPVAPSVIGTAHMCKMFYRQMMITGSGLFYTFWLLNCQ